MTPERARALFSTARVARLATVSAEGVPHLVPVVFSVCEERIYTAVDDKPKRTRSLRRLENVRARPAVCLLVDHYEEDWEALWWARADGVGRVLAGSEPEARGAVALLRERYPQQRGAGAVLAVEVTRWSGWEARQPPAR